MIKVLLDQGLPRSTASLLRAQGWDAQHVGELGMSQASDTVIIDLARVQQRMVVTLDADFHALLAVSGVSSPSVLRIRTEGLKAAQVVALMEKVVLVASSDLASGAMVTVSGDKMRIKLLPVFR